jgi:UDP-2,3-diacylglucosamine hydrolase
MTTSSHKGFVVSDLHIFAERSIANEHLEAIGRAARRGPCLVLNGDIFDFKWTTLKCIDSTIDQAVAWLEILSQEHPGCQIHYVLGNHDGLKPFAHRVAELCQACPNLKLHSAVLRLGNKLFMHGDLALDPGYRQGLERELMQSVRKKGRLMTLGYSLLTKSGSHRGISLFQVKKTQAVQIVAYLKHHHLHAGITDVYYGHTHVPFHNYHYDGIAFHNTGSTIRRLKPNFLEFPLD